MKEVIAILLLLTLPGIALATFQECDILKYDGKAYYTPVFPLEDCKTLPKRPNEIFPKTTSNVRDYVAVWEVQSNKLYLVDIGRNGSNIDLMFPHEWATLELLFPRKVKNGRVHAAWFTGTIFTPGRIWGVTLPKKYRRKQETNAQLLITIEKGKITKVEDKRTPNK